MTTATPVIRVVVADDSATSRRLIADIVRADPRFQVVGEAPDGRQAVRLVKKLRPDVVAMDIDMPDLNGLEATAQIMEECPTPVVLVSDSSVGAHTKRGMDALEVGALAILAKPLAPDHRDFHVAAAELTRTLRVMAGVRLVRRRPSLTRKPREPAAPEASIAVPGAARIDVVGIATSTGGPAALAQILPELPSNLPAGVLLVQHIADGFGEGLAAWLDSICSMRVVIAQNRQRIDPGQVLVAPDGGHLGVSRSGLAVVSHEPPVGGHRPSATHMFRTMATSLGNRGAGVILTGMGADGVDGLAELKRAGGRVLAQDEATSVVFGMPAEAVARGVVDSVLPLERIAGAIVALCAR